MNQESIYFSLRAGWHPVQHPLAQMALGKNHAGGGWMELGGSEELSVDGAKPSL